MAPSKTPRSSFPGSGAAPRSDTPASLERIEALLDANKTREALRAVAALPLKRLCDSHGEAVLTLLNRLTPKQREQVISPEQYELAEDAASQAAGKRITQTAMAATRRQLTGAGLGPRA